MDIETRVSCGPRKEDIIEKGLTRPGEELLKKKEEGNGLGLSMDGSFYLC